MKAVTEDKQTNKNPKIPETIKFGKAELKTKSD